MSDASDARIIARIAKQFREEREGHCQVCGCTGESCSMPAGEKCWWMNRTRTLCSNPQCVMAAHKSKRREKFAARRKVRVA